MKSPDQLNTLIDALEQVLIRVRCGNTLTQAVSDMPSIEAEERWCYQWKDLRDRILNGEIAAESIEALIAHLRLVSKIESLKIQKTQGPRMQARLIIALAIGFALISSFLFPPDMRPSGIMILTSWGLIALGHAWMRRELGRSGRIFWFADWLGFLAHLSAAVAWGQTLGSALQKTLEGHLHDSWPADLKRTTLLFFDACRNFEPLPPETWRIPALCSREERLAREQLRWIYELQSRGQPLAGTLDSFVKNSMEGLERRLTIEAEKLSLKLLAPLFLTYLPSFLLTLFGPIIKSVF